MASIGCIAESEITGEKSRKNLNICRALFRILFDGLRDGFAGRTEIRREDVAAIRRRFEESGMHVESLFDNTCSRCLDTPWYVRDERRRDSITRFLYARLIMKVPEKPGTKDFVYPRVVVAGLQAMAALLLSEREWRILNDYARFIFDYIGSDRDDVVAAQLAENPAVQLLSQKIFLPLLLRFRGFNGRRQEFIRIINNSRAETGYRMSDLEFCEVFEALFLEFHEMSESDEGRLKLALYHADDVPDQVRSIFDAYFRFKSGVLIQRLSKVRAGGG